MKHDHAIALEELKRAAEEKAEENDYLNEKVLKLQEENKQLILKKDNKSEQRKLEQEVAFLKAQLEQVENTTKTKTSDFSDKVVKKDLSPAQQIELQKEVAQLQRIVDGANEENQRADAKIRDLTHQLKQHEKKLTEEKKLTHELQMKHMLDRKKVFVEGEGEEVDI